MRRPAPPEWPNRSVSTAAPAGEQCRGVPGHLIDGVAFDHVAHAVPRWQDVWDRYAVDLGAVWNSGGPGPRLRPGSTPVRQPRPHRDPHAHDPDVNDFLVSASWPPTVPVRTI